MSKKPKNIQEYLDNSSLTSDGKLIHSITETHCHLDMLKNVDLNLLQDNLQKCGINRVITIGTSNKNFQVVTEIQKNSPSIYYTLGTHPHEAKDFTDKDIDFIRAEFAKNPKKLVAIGEIGLDYFYDYSPREIQISVFKKYLNLAIELNLPVVIHTRDADDDMAEILKEFAPLMQKKGVVHSFSSGIDLGKTAAQLGFFLGFNGMITFKNADNVREAVRNTPNNQLLIETDSPFLTPHPFRGLQNTPEFLPLVLEKLAELKNLSLQEMMKQVEENTDRCFFS